MKAKYLIEKGSKGARGFDVPRQDQYKVRYWDGRWFEEIVMADNDDGALNKAIKRVARKLHPATDNAHLSRVIRATWSKVKDAASTEIVNLTLSAEMSDAADKLSKPRRKLEPVQQNLI